MRANRGELFNETLASCLVVAAAVFMLVTTPSPAHADEAEELFKACTRNFYDEHNYGEDIADEFSRRVLNSCNRLIERYSGDLSRNKLGEVYLKRGYANRQLEQYSSANSDYRKAIELGNTTGYFGLGGLYDLGLGVPKDERRAKEIYKEGCDLGNTQSCAFLISIELP